MSDKSLETLITMLADIKREQELLESRKAEIHQKIMEIMPSGDYTGDNGKVKVTTRKTFKADIATQLIDEAKLPKKDLDRLFNKSLNRKMLSALYPDIEQQAMVESAPYIIFQESK